MSLKTEEPTVDVLALFPKDADTSKGAKQGAAPLGIGAEASTGPSTCRLIVVTLLPRRKTMNEQQREEKQNKVSNFSHKTFV